MTKDVTKPTKQTVPPTAEPLKKMPPVGPATTVSGNAGPGVASAGSPDKPTFKLPDTVTTEDMKLQGRKYGNTW